MIDALLKKTGQNSSKKGFQIIAEEIGGLSENYLYSKIFLVIKRKKPDDIIRFHDTPIKNILRFLGFENFGAFIQYIENPVPKQLQQYTGNYYSYVRRSLDVGTVFRSPVRIYEQKGNVWAELRGARLTYTGEVKFREGCLFVPLISSSGKAFYHIYKVGNSVAPQVLQGTFSGVSNAFDPIAGRAVLVKTKNDFDKLENAELKIEDMMESSSIEERCLADYFREYSENNLAIKRTYTFDIRDLGCK